jgi:hypothetical protein
MVSSFVVFTDTTVGLRRAAPHRAAALDLPGGGLISRTAAGFRQGPRPPAGAASSSPTPPGEGVDGPLEVGQLGDDRRPEQLIVGRGDGADAYHGSGAHRGAIRPLRT